MNVSRASKNGFLKESDNTNAVFYPAEKNSIGCALEVIDIFAVRNYLIYIFFLKGENTKSTLQIYKIILK